MKNVLITPMTLKSIRGPYFNLLLEAGLSLHTPPEPWDHQLTEEELSKALTGMDAVIAGSEPYTEKVLRAHPKLKVIARVGVGYDAVDVKTATAMKVAVAITPGANHDTVAEHAFALLLALTKHITTADAGMRQGQWKRAITVPLRNRTLGLVGLGRIGKAMTIRARAFGMKVIAHEPTPDANFVLQHDIELLPLEAVMRQADFLSLHVPAIPATRHMINAQSLSLMKPTAYLLNTARGALVDEAALADAVRSRKIAGAGLDVYEDEPMPKQHPFYSIPQIVMTPHTGGTDEQSIQDMAYLAAKAVVEIHKGNWPKELLVNPEVSQHS